MKLAIICGGRDAVEKTDTPLQFIENSMKKVEETLELNNWICKPLRIDTLENYNTWLDDICKSEQVEEFLFYYTGHGVYGNSISQVGFQLCFKEQKATIAQLIDETRKVFSTEKEPKKIGFVIDSCYSGDAITERYNDEKFEILTSSDSSKSYEKKGLYKDNPDYGISVFSYYFCTIFNEVEQNDVITLEDISNFVNKSQEKQEPLYSKALKRDKIIIGHNKEINELTNFLKENHTLKTLKEKLLTYYPRRASNHNKIRHTDNFSELMNILLNERKYLKCILKEFDFESSIVNEHTTVDCQELKQKVSLENKIDKLIIKVEESTEKGLDSATISGYYGYTSGEYSPTKTVSDLDLSGEKSLIEIPKYIDEVLIGKKARNIELQLILPDVLLPLDYQTEEMNSRFVLLKRLVRRLNNHHLLGIEDEIDYWEENSQLIKKLKDNIAEKHIDNRGCVSLYNKHEQNIAMLYNESLSSQIKEVYDWGVPILFYPHENMNELKLEDCVVADFKNKMSAFMTNEFVKGNATHFIYDDYYDVDFLPKTDI